MSATAVRVQPSSIATRLDGVAFALLAVLPLGMALLNRSAQPILAAAALAAVSARLHDGRAWDVRETLLRLIRTPIGACLLAFLIYGAAAIGWSHQPRTSLAAYGEVLLSVVSVAALHAALPRAVPAWVLKLATIAIALGCLTIMAELASGMASRRSLGLRPDLYIFKRSASAISLVAWPIAVFLWLAGKRSIAIALALLLTLATYSAHSSATSLGLVVGSVLVAVAILSRRALAAVVAAGFLAAMLGAPVIGDAADRLLPPALVSKLEAAHARDRIQIWQSFGEVVKRRPVLGAGFGVSPAMAKAPVAAEVPDDRRVLLGAWHPHNGYLQVWAELGAVGAGIATFALLLVALALARLPTPGAVAAAGLIGSAAAIMLVGHGVWQGWWSATIGAAAIWIARLPPGGAPAAVSPERALTAPRHP